MEFRFEELRIFGPGASIPAAYIRAFTSELRLWAGQEGPTVLAYPVITLYETGVLLVELRVIGPDRGVPAREFVERWVNLFKARFERVYAPPRLAELITRAAPYVVQEQWPLRSRPSLWRFDARAGQEAEAETMTSKSGPIEVSLAPIWGPDGLIGGEGIRDVAEYLFHAIRFALSSPRRGIALLLLGQRRPLTKSGYWDARPNIHLTRFTRQGWTAADNERRHGELFQRILATTWLKEEDLPQFPLPSDLRPMGDYAAYVTPAATLWVWSLRGIEETAAMAARGQGARVPLHQVKVHLLNYGYHLYRRILEESIGAARSSEVLQTRRELLLLREQLSDSARFGELRNFFAIGWEAMGLARLQGMIDGALEVEQSATSLREGRRVDRIGLALSVLFGIMAVPSVATDILIPAWSLLDWWRPLSETAFHLMLTAVALLVVGGIVAVLIRPILDEP